MDGWGRTALRFDNHLSCWVVSLRGKIAACTDYMAGRADQLLGGTDQSVLVNVICCLALVVGVVAGGFGSKEGRGCLILFLPPLGFLASRLPRLRSLANAVLPDYGVLWVALWVIAWPVAERSSPAPAVVWQAPSRGAPRSMRLAAGQRAVRAHAYDP